MSNGKHRLRITAEDALDNLIMEINQLGRTQNTEVFPMSEYDRMRDACIQISQGIAAMKVRYVLWGKRNDDTIQR